MKILGILVMVAGCSVAACGSSDKGSSGGGTGGGAIGSGGSASGSGGNSSAGGSSSGDTVDAATTCSEILTAACERLKACGMVLGQTDASLQCIGDCAAVVSAGSGACVGRAASGETFSKATVDACVTALGASSCDDACTGTDPSACSDLAKLSGNTGTPPTCDPACVNGGAP